MKSVLISIHPEQCEKIADREQTIDVRKTRPKIETPFTEYIYCTKGSKWHGCYDHDNNMFGLIHTKNLALADKYNLEICDGKVIGEFVCDDIIIDEHRENLDAFERCGKMSRLELTAYGATDVIGSHLKKDKRLYGWHISNLKIYDKPKELNEFYRWYDDGTDIRPCQNGKSCCYIFYDYSEDCQACGIDYDGTDCPFLKVQCPPQSWMYVEEIL